jgi:hypothetical protein
VISVLISGFDSTLDVVGKIQDRTTIAIALTSVISAAETEEVTIANLMRMVEFRTTKIVEAERYNFNNK